MPQLSPEQRRARAEGVAKWVKSLPLASRPLVKTSVKMLSEEGVMALQRSMPYMVCVVWCDSACEGQCEVLSEGSCCSTPCTSWCVLHTMYCGGA